MKALLRRTRYKARLTAQRLLTAVISLTWDIMRCTRAYTFSRRLFVLQHTLLSSTNESLLVFRKNERLNLSSRQASRPAPLAQNVTRCETDCSTFASNLFSFLFRRIYAKKIAKAAHSIQQILFFFAFFPPLSLET
jgi:hypothetical protein